MKWGEGVWGGNYVQRACDGGHKAHLRNGKKGNVPSAQTRKGLVWNEALEASGAKRWGLYRSLMRWSLSFHQRETIWCFQYGQVFQLPENMLACVWRRVWKGMDMEVEGISEYSRREWTGAMTIQKWKCIYLSLGSMQYVECSICIFKSQPGHLWCSVRVSSHFHFASSPTASSKHSAVLRY